MNNIIRILGTNIKNTVSKQYDFIESNAVEIRLRVNSPILIKSNKREFFLEETTKVTKKDIDDTVSNITKNSIHAFEKEIRSGYITVEGGHRVGLGGDCIYEGNIFKGFKNITSLNIRIAREFPGCTRNYLKYFMNSNKNIYNTLIIGPPLSGKTTFIRDISVNLSDGIKFPYFEGCDVTLIDERGEISSVFNGVPQMYVGRRTDVLSYCMKKEGFFMSIRALSPKVIISDELGSKEDFEIIQYALKSGVNIIATAHGFGIEDVKKNIYMRSIIENNFFDRALILKSSKSPSVAKEVYDFQRNKVIFNDVG
ncbi:MAG: stage III sporulation protein AA [Sedimentibacter sp.]|uniref:stage III sporulation protein AA n=1 Tax=Sedimentibacter sp. TaxID=1960295 RepID=UPI0029828FE5|nr:stage III sporulation protein AA [Sedimentibacter sp.]MDW5300332.1 stage III sporulation protein AA [Sedimentibacter sp.]